MTKEGIINLQREFEEEEKNNSYQITFDLSSEQIKTPIYCLIKYSQIVLNEIKNNSIFNELSDKLNEYQKTQHINKDNIKLFFKILKEENNDFTIKNDEFIDLCKLTTFFQVKKLEKYLKKYLNEHSHDIDFIINLILEKENNYDNETIFNLQFTIEMESCLSKNINECLQNEKFSQIKQSIIYRLLEKNNEFDSSLLYKFICKSIKERHIFFKFVKVEELSDELFNDLYNNYKNSKLNLTEHYYEYLPIDLNYIQQIKTEKNMLESRISKIEFQMKEEKTLNEQREQLLTKNIEELKKIIEELKEENDKIQQINEDDQIQINKQKEIIDNYQIIESKVDEQNEIISKYQKDKDELEKEISIKDIKMKELLKASQLKTTITAQIDTSNMIKCQINIIERGTKLDIKRSKYILNQDNCSTLGEENYQDGTAITELNSEFSINKPPGTYFLHALIIDNYGQTEELISNSLIVQKPFNFEFTGKVQEITLDPGNYKLEVWGASGGENNEKCNKDGNIDETYSGTAGKGGYSVGTLNLQKKTTLYVYVGGSSTNNLGGWNGGGSANSPGAGGGGSTDISLYCSTNKTEWNTEEHLYSRIIVAGGGGGSGLGNYPGWKAGCGGGENGEAGQNSNSKGGTQTAGYKFGCGQSNTLRHSSGGGGGWYGGYAFSHYVGWGPGGGGGSGFVYNSSTASNYPNGCKLNSTFYLTDSRTISGNDEIPTPYSKNALNSHIINGYAKITPQ